jgi:ubiquitin-like-conjugating enzyme ATG3
MSSFIQNILVSKMKSARDYLTPVLTTSQFYEKGHLTPEEFVSAGDYLIRLSPTWTWARGDVSRAKPYLPPDKQFIILKCAPCRQRCRFRGEEDSDHDIISMFASEQVVPALPSSPSLEIDDCDRDDDNEYGDLAHFIEPVLNVIDMAVKSAPVISVSETVDEIRTYELTIVYDNYYRTPRVYLRGFANDGRPLGPVETMEDVMQDYINKTATIEPHPHTGIQCVSIHPCRHAATMKRILDVMITNNDGRLPSVNMYMFLFIKFIGSMIPTIEYDNTMPISVSK